VGLFRRRKKRIGLDTGHRYGRAGFAPDDLGHLREFVATRRGVEAYVEPATNVTPWTVVLVAHDGEWTRRPCDAPEAAREFAAKAAIPVYDVKATGYPARMREWSSAQRRGAPRRLTDSPVEGRPTDEQLPPDPFG